MMSAFTIFLLSWLAVGFLVGVKAIFVEQILTDENIKLLKEKASEQLDTSNPAFDIAFNLMTNKKSLLAIFTLLGYIALFLDIKGSIKKFKKLFTKKRGK